MALALRAWQVLLRFAILYYCPFTFLYILDILHMVIACRQNRFLSFLVPASCTLSLWIVLLEAEVARNVRVCPSLRFVPSSLATLGRPSTFWKVRTWHLIPSLNSAAYPGHTFHSQHPATA
jgi:hypothetical protein